MKRHVCIWFALSCCYGAATSNISLAATPELASLTADSTEYCLPSMSEASPVRLWRSRIGSKSDTCFVITHGMGGTRAGDRFHRLAETIREACPTACVMRVDWSEAASAPSGSLPNPWKVAAHIDRIGDLAARLLGDAAIDPNRIVLIGESFGNWVNARMAQRLGGVHGILALNPAHEAGGYVPPDLRKCARRSWSFHTYSIFDTTLQIADQDFFLETAAQEDHWQQHVAGIRWLTDCIAAGDSSWLHFDKSLPAPSTNCFTAMATQDGQLLNRPMPRKRPKPQTSQTDVTVTSAR